MKLPTFCKTKPSHNENAAKPVSKWRRNRGALALIGGLLLTSAFVRVGSGTGQAMAKELSGNVAYAESGAGHDRPTVSCTAEEDIAPVLAALTLREGRIRKSETDIRTRMQALSVAEIEIDRKMTALEEAETKLRGTLALASTAAEDDLTRLTDVYANMKPKQASALFEEMTPEFAAGFLGRMRPDAAATIMAGLSPKSAYTISVVLAGRNAEVPKE
ncbi:MotE family protein [Puniceibacterium sp. IMCC21224]|uniref:MotE family protein n=1 Tax=Puniceibacterium sp. IMCC21224 TaxID=1618204 RepID=UPI00064D93C9|nr:hypothetical protein [Puniceibacterium sp. IMCC21224]KMK68853.1 hypothetical protein IMCC21224_113739 [Puniceibacterium sp. IMCC21224]